MSVTVFRDVNFQGPSQVLQEGRSTYTPAPKPNLLFGDITARPPTSLLDGKSISSVRVSPGFVATLADDLRRTLMIVGEVGDLGKLNFDEVTSSVFVERLQRATDLDPAARFNIMSGNRVLTVEDGATDDGARVILAAPVANPLRDNRHQLFAFEPSGDGGYVIRAQHSGKVLEARDRLVQQTRSQAANQVFDIYLTSAGDWITLVRQDKLAGLSDAKVSGALRLGNGPDAQMSDVLRLASGPLRRFVFPRAASLVRAAQDGTLAPSGNAAIDSRIAQLGRDGIGFNLFGVPFSTPFRFNGDVSVSTSGTTVTFSGAAALAAPFQRDLGRLTVSLAPSGASIDATVRADIPFSPAALVQEQVQPRVDPTAWRVVNSTLMPYLRLYDNPSVIIASADGSVDDLGSYSPGINLYKSVRVSDVEPFKALNNAFPVLKLEQRQLLLRVAMRPSKEPSFLAEGILVLNQELGTRAVVLNSLGLSIEQDTTELSAGAGLQLTLNLGGDQLRIHGGIQGQASAEGGGASLSIWGALDAENGEWKNPFGIRGLSIVGFGAQIGATSTFPFVSLGVRGEARIGGSALQASVAAFFDPADPAASVLQLESPQGINLTKLLDGLLSATTLEPLKSSGLDRYDLALRDVLINVAPKGATIAGKDYDAGFALRGKLDLFGLRASVDGKFDYTSGGYLYGEMDKIVLKARDFTFLEVTAGAAAPTGGLGGPRLQVDFSTEKQGLRVSGRVALLNGAFSESLDATADKRGFDIAFGSSAAGLYQGVTASYRGGQFAASLGAGFSFGFKLGDYDLTLAVSAQIAVLATKDSFEQILRFTYNAFGQARTLGPISWSVPLPDASAVKNLFEKYGKEYGDAIASFFTETIKRETEQAIKYLKDHVEANAEKLGKLCVAVGADAGRVAQGLVIQCGTGVKDATRIVAANAEAAAKIIKDTFNQGAQETAALLKDGYNLTAEETTALLKSSYDLTAEQVSVALKGVGYAAEQVAKVLVNQCGQTAEQATRLVAANAEEAAKVMKNAFGKGAKETADFLKDGYNLADDKFSQVLSGAGYAADETKDAVNYMANKTMEALNKVKDGAKTVWKKIKKFW